MVADSGSTLDRDVERQLVARAQSGDGGATRELIDLHKDRLFAFIWRMIRHHHDAEEVCQDTFLKAFASLSSFSSEYRFSTWLFTIGYRVCLNRMRRKRPITSDLDLSLLPPADDVTPSDHATSEEAAELRSVLWGGG